MSSDSKGKNNLVGCLIALTASLLWGFSFVVQSDVELSPFTFSAIRCTVAALFLCAVYFGKKIIDKHFRKNGSKAEITESEDTEKTKKHTLKDIIVPGIICGIMMSIGMNFQQLGISNYPDGVPGAARAGFITALYVIFVPILAVFLKKKIHFTVWISTVLALAGIYLLCLYEGIDGIYISDFYLLCGAVGYSLHITSIDIFSKRVDGILLSLMQFTVGAVVAGMIALSTEVGTVSLPDIKEAIPGILYVGILSSGVAFTLQIVAQMYADAALCSLSMSPESVFAAIGGWLVLGDALTVPETIGCCVVFAAIIIPQIPDLIKFAKARKKEKNGQ